MLIVTINPGATSTKFGVFEDDKLIFEKNLSHSVEELKPFNTIYDQYEYRLDIILSALKEANVEIKKISAVVGRGGLLRPIQGGTYLVTDKMLDDLKSEIRGAHASNLGACLAKAIADKAGVQAFIVDPVAVDEFQDVARISGLPEIPRISLLHALNHKAIAREVAAEMGKEYEELKFVIAHLGTGISIAAHKNGKAIDVNDARGEGPFSCERCGGVNAYLIMKLAFSGKYTEKELSKKMGSEGGLYAHLGTKDIREINKMIEEGNEDAELILDAMAYQIAKEIGAQATVLSGEVDAIILTGGIAYAKNIVEKITNRISFIAPVKVVPGERELDALALGGLRVLNGTENYKEY